MFLLDEILKCTSALQLLETIYVRESYGRICRMAKCCQDLPMSESAMLYIHYLKAFSLVHAKDKINCWISFCATHFGAESGLCCLFVCLFKIVFVFVFWKYKLIRENAPLESLEQGPWHLDCTSAIHCSSPLLLECWFSRIKRNNFSWGHQLTCLMYRSGSNNLCALSTLLFYFITVTSSRGIFYSSFHPPIIPVLYDITPV